MNTHDIETVLRSFLTGDGYIAADDIPAICATIEAALQSQDREDALRYRYLSSMATQQADTLGPIFRIDVRRTPKALFNFDAAVDQARRIEGENHGSI